MQYGFVIPGGDARLNARLAREAEEAGWDGVFVPDCIYIPGGEDELTYGHDPWIVMAAIAMSTERVKFGAMVTPLSRRPPWKVARETTTLDHLSNGRLILQVGLGALDDGGFGKVGEATDRKTRAELLDESLAIVDGLWSGKPFSFSGKHYHVEEMTFLPKPVQQPRISVWVVAAWPRQKSMERALKWDGIIPSKLNDDGTFGEITPEDIRAIRSYAEERRPQGGTFDIVMEGRTPGDDRRKQRDTIGPLAEAGVTWWIEAMWTAPNSLEDIIERLRQGPPNAG